MKKRRNQPLSVGLLPRVWGVTIASPTLYLAVVLAAFCPSLFFHQAYFEGDLIAQNIPYWDFFKNCLSHGHWPLWCPYLFAGQPYLADSNCMVFYPPAYFYLLDSRSLGTGLYYGFHLLAALVGMHLWLKAVGLSPGACRVGAVLYGLSGFFWWEIIHPQVLAGYAWLPWWGFTVEKFARSWEKRWAFAMGLFLALLFLCGHFQVLLGAFYGGLIYFFFRFFNRPQNRLRNGDDWKNAFSRGLVLAWGALPLLALAIPFFELSTYSGRIHEASDYLHFNAELSDNPHQLLKFLFPLKAWGPDQFSISYLDILEDSGYLGIWFPFLAFWAFRSAKRRKWVWFWSAGALFTLLLVLGKYTPLHQWLCETVMGFKFVRAPYRFIYLFALAGTFLAAFGWEFLEAQAPKRPKHLGLWIFLYVVVLSFLGIFFFRGQSPAVLGLLLGGAGLWICFQGDSTARRQRAGQWLFVAALAISMILNGWQTCPSRLGPESNFDFVRNRPELIELKQKTGLGRTFIDGNIPYPLRVNGKFLSGFLPPDTAYSLGIRDVQGYNPISLWKVSQLFSLPFEDVARLLAIQSIAKGTADPFSQAGFKQEKWGPIYFWAAPVPYPFVYAPERFEVVASDGRRLGLMGQKDFNPYRLSYFSDPPPPGAPEEDLPSPNSLSYRLTRDDPDEEVFQVQKGKSGWTVFSEVVYPGWKAWVDAKPAVLLTANHVFRTVFVPAGDHEVRFSYEPVWWTPIRIGLVLWVLSVLGLFFRPFRRWVLGK
jgi:hypothetical protein